MYSLTVDEMYNNALNYMWKINHNKTEISYKRRLALTLGQKQRQREATVWPQFGLINPSQIIGIQA